MFFFHVLGLDVFVIVVTYLCVTLVLIVSVGHARQCIVEILAMQLVLQ